MGICNSIGKNLEAYRKKRGLSQLALSHLSGVHRTIISAIERGQSNPRSTTIQKLADALNITVMQLTAEYDESGGLIFGRSSEKDRKKASMHPQPKRGRGRKRKTDLESGAHQHGAQQTQEVNYALIAWGDSMMYGVNVEQDNKELVLQTFDNLRKRGLSGDELTEKFEEIWPKIKELYELN